VLFLAINGMVVAGLTAATEGWFRRHLAVASTAPVSPKYTWFMLTRRPYEAQIRYLFVFPALAGLTVALTSARRKAGSPDAHRPDAVATRDSSAAQGGSGTSENGAAAQIRTAGRALWIAGIFFVLSLGAALATGMRQGSDRNYLIEPTLAAGMVMGAWASRVARVRDPREWLITRAAAVLALFSPMLLNLPDRFRGSDETDRMAADILSPYRDEAMAWVRTLPQPLLCLDSWLAYRAGVANDLNDPIAYRSYCLSGGTDPVTERVRERRYACIVTMVPVDGPDYAVYGDIESFWPRFREAMMGQYSPQGQCGSWHAYTRRSEAGGVSRKRGQDGRSTPATQAGTASASRAAGGRPLAAGGFVMSDNQRGRVLDVGQCGVDHASIRSLISANFRADVDRVASIEGALAMLRERRYDLVLVNRIIDADGSEGIELIHGVRQEAPLRDMPIMLVSNYPDAQAEAVAAGARPGFGKAELYHKATSDRLAEFLPRKAARE